MATAMPMFAVGKSSTSSPAKCAFMSRWRMSASAHGLREDVRVGRRRRRPLRCARRALSRRRIDAVMSADMAIWKAGACHASVMRRAIVLRIAVELHDLDLVRRRSGAAAGAGSDLPRARRPRRRCGPRARCRAAAKVDTALLRDPPRERRGLHAAAVAAPAARARSDPAGLLGFAATLALGLARGRGLALLGRLLLCDLPVSARSGARPSARSPRHGDLLALLADDGDRPSRPRSPRLPARGS